MSSVAFGKQQNEKRRDNEHGLQLERKAGGKRYHCSDASFAESEIQREYAENAYMLSH